MTCSTIKNGISLQHQNGISLVETLIALAILGLVGVGFLGSLTTGSLSTKTLDQQVLAESLARTLLEDIKSQPYFDGYPEPYAVTVTPPSGYFVTATAQSADPDPLTDNIQEITVKVTGSDGKLLIQIQTLKAKR